MGRRSKERIANLESTVDHLNLTTIRYGRHLDELFRQLADLNAAVEKLKKESK
jgi:hypothetical protein